MHYLPLAVTMCGLFCGKHWAYTSDSVFFYRVSRFLSSDYAFQVYVREQFEELKGGGEKNRKPKDEKQATK